jgi:hypothetical protein
VYDYAEMGCQEAKKTTPALESYCMSFVEKGVDGDLMGIV